MSWFGFWRRQAKTAAEPRPASGLFHFVGGRRHVAGVPYALPKDDAEINRLDFQHYMLRYALRGNYLAPLDKPRDILDVGSGSGRWTQEMALTFPDANVFGLDLAPPPAEAATDGRGVARDTRPPNYVFVAGNVLEGLPFADASFDFTHQRLLFAAIPRPRCPRWPQVVSELARVTRPGGWVELVEGSVGAGAASPAERMFTQWALAVTARREIDLQIGPHLPTFLREAGLANVTTREVQIPIGKHGGRLGRMMQTDVLAVIQGLRGPTLATGITDAATFDATIKQWLAEADHYRSHWAMYVVCGQRLA
ncbi:MAG TPA: class I SAM-dependent methyltransferase [Ktedonobacterales bacterium]|nr:class I SAM-dependent methyltransferase [Ktedonobacterales bacterium]